MGTPQITVSMILFHNMVTCNVTSATNADVVMLMSKGQRCWRLHGHPHFWRLLRSRHFVDALSAKPGPEQPPAGLCVPLGCLCYDWWVGLNDIMIYYYYF